MKSKYAPLVKLKKKELDRVEHDLIRANNAFSAASIALDEAYTLLSTLSLPANGSIIELLQAQVLIQTQHAEIQNSVDKLALAKAQQLQMQRQFKASMIEYEKFNYLEVQEEQAYTAKMKKEEAKMLDEIGVMTYKREPL
ncbi:MAG: flagellar export protein FliJ [Sulfuricurvum sp.]